MARKNEYFFVERIRNPYTGETVRISAEKEIDLIRLFFKQYRVWEKEYFYWGEPSQRHSKTKYYLRENVDVWDFNTGKKGAWLNIDNPTNDYLYGIRSWLPIIYYYELKISTGRGFFKKAKRLFFYLTENTQLSRLGIIEEFLGSAQNNKNRLTSRETIEKRQRRLDTGKMRGSELKQELEHYFFWVLTKDSENHEIYDQLHYTPTVRLDYHPASRKLTIDMQMPTVKQVRNVKIFRLEDKSGTPISVKEAKADCKGFYNHLIFELTLRIILLLYASDAYHYIDDIAFNGYRMYVDRSKGRLTKDCIISLSFPREEYAALRLHNTDAEAVIKRINPDVPTDFFEEPMKVQPC